MENFAINEWDTISLHDCRINFIAEENHNITFHFVDGYWITEKNSHNVYKKTLGTDDKAQVTMKDAHCNSIVVNDEIISWHEFSRKINDSEWEFECVSETYGEIAVYDGWIWFQKEPYHFESKLQFTYSQMVYEWNSICEDRPW